MSEQHTQQKVGQVDSMQ